jgi:FkbM family methyltransferase
MESASEVLTKIKKFGFYPENVLDIGAYKGEWSLGVGKIWKKANFYLVEANSDMIPFLLTVKSKDSVIALLGDSDGKEVIYYKCLKQFESGNSIFLENTNYFNRFSVSKLQMITLDTLALQKKWPQFDLVKIDTQGSEGIIIDGGKNTLRGVQVVLLEVQLAEYNLGAPMIDEIIAKMTDLEFLIYDIFDSVPFKNGRMAQVNLMFVKKGHKLHNL